MHKTLNSPPNALLQKQPCAGFRNSQSISFASPGLRRSCCLQKGKQYLYCLIGPKLSISALPSLGRLHRKCREVCHSTSA